MTSASVGEHELWYRQAAAEWTEALPLGNGRLGAMVFGGPLRERFQLNDGTAWSGSASSESAPPRIEPEVAAQALAESRRAIRRGDHTAADAALQAMQHRYSQTFLPFADLEIGIALAGAAGSPAVSDYRRSLDLSTATHTTEYELSGHAVRQRSFVSHSAGALVIEITTEHGDGLDLRVHLSSPLLVTDRRARPGESSLLLRLPVDVAPSHDEVEEPIRYSDDESASLAGALVVLVDHDGSDNGELIEGARHVRIIATSQTTFAGLGREPVGTAEDAYATALARAGHAAGSSLEELWHEHVLVHSELYGRVELTLGHASGRPVDERLLLRGGLEADPGLAALLYHYGRYLLICSSRAGGVPANLQGIWNAELQPVWSSNYTTNINLQMNYWLAEVANLPECLPPLFDLIDALAESGKETARRLYDAPGWVAHHNTDVWAYSQPVGLGSHDPKWAFWPMAGPWLIRHLWARIEYGADRRFIEERAWAPVLGAAEFCLQWLVEEPDGSLGTIPSTSPENQFLTDDGRIASAGASSTNDLVVIADLFDILGRIAVMLGRESDPVVVEAARARSRIRAPRISRDGRIREWAADVDYPDPHHRHVSHLYFVYPGRWPADPELDRAAALTLDSRGDESTGWSLVWKLALRARLRQPQKVSDLLALIFRSMAVDRGPWSGGLYPNMFSAHPPFAIDGNLGYVAGLSECFLQSDSEGIDVLPAVPPEFPRGRIAGLVAVGGFEVDITWHTIDGVATPTRVSVRSPRADAAGALTVRFGGESIPITVEPFGSAELDAREFEENRSEAAIDHRPRLPAEVFRRAAGVGEADAALLVERQ